MPAGESPTSRGRSRTSSSMEALVPSQILGARVLVMQKHTGIVRFAGETKFASGQWLGVELDVPQGKNDGSVQGVRYFDCPPQSGLFCRPNVAEVTVPPPTEGDASRPGLPKTPSVSSTAAADSLATEVEAIVALLPPQPRVCILGGTAFQNPNSEALVKAMGKAFVAHLAGSVVVVTGGMPGVQKTFATSLGANFPGLVHLLPAGQSSGFGVGKDMVGGTNLEERIAIFGQLGHIYISVEGGPGVAKEAAAAFKRNAVVLPMISTGGASSGLFGFPEDALKMPAFATMEQWSCLRETVPPEKAADAVVELIRCYLPAGQAKKTPEPLAIDSPKKKAGKKPRPVLKRAISESWPELEGEKNVEAPVPSTSRPSVDGLLNGSSVFKTHRDKGQAALEITAELANLQEKAALLEQDQSKWLAREAAAMEVLAKANATKRASEVPAGLEAWLSDASSRLARRAEDKIADEIQEMMSSVLAGVVVELQHAKPLVQRIKK
eukprot:TRINITY_DN63465_c0_g1_i1.p1 TRINITY_DN63465_c0_g1~~TRINITY_DN63465_c0_g1_i1.p1  ORF type:complete len:495 (-),score=106.94 TRINITY_DN63465_c0_g1_i1:82-1566(-)